MAKLPMLPSDLRNVCTLVYSTGDHLLLSLTRGWFNNWNSPKSYKQFITKCTGTSTASTSAYCTREPDLGLNIRSKGASSWSNSIVKLELNSATVLFLSASHPQHADPFSLFISIKNSCQTCVFSGWESPLNTTTLTFFLQCKMSGRKQTA